MNTSATFSANCRLDKIRSHYVETERDEEFLHQLNRLLKRDSEGTYVPEPVRFTGNSETRGVAFIEPSGGGKTSTISRALSKHPALSAKPGETWARYLRIQVPSPATLKSLGREVLVATGLPEVSSKSTAWEIWSLVRHRLALLNIVVLWFDEAHDMFLSGSAREIDDMLKMLKTLMQSEAAVILVLSGTERLAEITSYDPQVNRRFTKVVPKPLCQGVDSSNLFTLIKYFCDEVGLKFRGADDLTGRLIHASRRRFGRAVETMIDAIECAIEEKSPELCIDHFAQAWGMQEGCEWSNNVFVASDWAAIELDAEAKAFESARTARQTSQLGRK